MIRVLFVCLGNICRSPMAEAVFQHKVRLSNLTDRIESDSAGTGSWHVGARPHAGTRNLLATKAIDYDHAARVIRPDDFLHFDYILTMDDDNLETVRAISARAGGTGKARLAPFLDYAPQAGVREVPDPYYSGNFEEVYVLVEQAAAGLLAAICRDHNLICHCLTRLYASRRKRQSVIRRKEPIDERVEGSTIVLI